MITNSIAVNANGKVQVLVPGVQKLAVKLTLKNGQFGGSFLHPVFNKRIKFDGLLLQPDNAGAGLFKGSNETGAVILEPTL